MTDYFKHALQAVLAHEGGFSHHPNDPGGATKYGITQAVLREWRGVPVTVEHVRALQVSEAGEIYRARYWNACNCDALPPGISYAVFDCAVNQGVGRATRFLQQSCGAAVDGHIGPKTLAAVRAAMPGQLLNEFSARRMHAYGRLQSMFRTFGLGWSRRLIDCHSLALHVLAASSQAATPAPALPAPRTQPEPQTAAPDQARPSPEQLSEQEEKHMSQQPQQPAQLNILDSLLGGGLLFGRKTIIGIVGYMIVYFGDKMGIAPDFLTPEMVEMLTTALLGLAGLGAASKAVRIEAKLDAEKKAEFDPFAIR